MKRPAPCHPSRAHYAHELCERCYYRAFYHRGRTEGLPSWRAQGGSVQRWIGHYQRVKEWRHRNPQKASEQYRRKRARRKELYGDQNLRTMASRIKWSEARSARTAAANTQRSANGARSVDPQISCSEGRCRLIGQPVSAAQLLRLFATADRRERRLHERAIKGMSPKDKKRREILCSMILRTL